jgi:hypothetical protein
MINQIGRVKEEDKGEDSDWDEVKQGEEELYLQGCHLLRLNSKEGLKGREDRVIEGQEKRAGLQQTMHKDNSCLSLPPPISLPSPDPEGLEVSIQEREGRVGGLHAEDTICTAQCMVHNFMYRKFSTIAWNNM